MPLSKTRNRERMRLAMRVKRQMLQPNSEMLQPSVIPEVVQPKLPFYAGAEDHFGEVKSKYYAEQFFANVAT